MALVNKIIPFSCVDGDGNRMVIFFQGCNIKCKYCHNPETINKCVDCGLCIESCKSFALSKVDGKVIWDSKKCTSCDACIRTCTRLSTPKTIEYSVDNLFNEIEKARCFIQGITVSGGECTLNSEFLVMLFKKVKEIGLTCYVDTNGTIDLEKKKELFDLTDKFMLDVKSISEEKSMILTGGTNKIVLKNLHYILEANKMYEVRTVIANNLDSENTVDKVSKIIKDKCRYKLIKYRHYGVREEGIKFHGKVSPDDVYLETLKKVAIENSCIDTIIT